MPAARYSFGATVLPVWPIWAVGVPAASTTARVAAAAPAERLGQRLCQLEALRLAEPAYTGDQDVASSMFTSAPRCSPRWTITALVEWSSSWTSTSTTSAAPLPGSAMSKALRRPMMPGSPT